MLIRTRYPEVPELHEMAARIDAVPELRAITRQVIPKCRKITRTADPQSIEMLSSLAARVFNMLVSRRRSSDYSSAEMFEKALREDAATALKCAHVVYWHALDRGLNRMPYQWQKKIEERLSDDVDGPLDEWREQHSAEFDPTTTKSAPDEPRRPESQTRGRDSKVPDTVTARQISQALDSTNAKLKKRNIKVYKKHIWTVMGYKSDTEFRDVQAENQVQPAVTRKFQRAMNLLQEDPPTEFLREAGIIGKDVTL